MRQPLFVKISSKKSVCFVFFIVVKYNAEIVDGEVMQNGRNKRKKAFILIFNRSIGKADR